ncbi:hypothetical protein PoB_001180600 [Plakobranchus ocellatus]|uniref:Uncharacterized protein n=1 Tax=Plakobranchus ocellatus TaxID=259542 RepID=A0AAV3YSE1_9GAST|nr:hypothetical protein PoB_001180600 [Plakobranchus ocellatus]
MERRSGGSSGWAVDYHVRGPRFESQLGPRHFLLLLCVHRPLASDPTKAEAARKAMANYLIMPYAKNSRELLVPRCLEQAWDSLYLYFFM